MPETLTVPELGEGVDSVDVVAVLVSVGDTVQLEQPVIEVETEKASVEVPSTVTGKVLEVHVTVGDTLGAGSEIITVDGTGAPTGEAEPPVSAAEDSGAAEEAPEADSATPVDSAPEVSTDDDRRGAPVQQEEPVVDEIEAVPSSTFDASREPVPAAPTVRRFARELGVDISQVAGAGPGGRISIDDVKGFASRLLSRAADEPTAATAPQLPDFSAWGPIRTEPMSKIRQVTATNMARAWSTVPQVTNHDAADITELEQQRKQYRDRVEAAGGKLTLTAMIVKVVASALRAFPSLNASIDPANKEIIFKEYVHIGVAVDTERGLLVPVIRDADRKNITEISAELDDLAGRARERKLKPDEMQGASFSISNLGGIGGTGFSPIVNWPEVAVLGVSRGRIEAQWGDGEFRPRLILPLSLSYDHRLVDGAEAARFLRWLAEAIEQPLLLALEG
jgi:pyruvate dehydrogenase E2 component (dihydrolipoamide acetyltransferase)